MSKRLITVIAIALLMAGTAWAGDSTIGVNVGNGATINTAWSGANGSVIFNGQLGNTLGNSANVNVFNAGVTTYNGNANLANTGYYPNPVGGNYVAYTASALDAAFTGGGWSNFDVTRNLSYTPGGYGPGGQVVFGNVSSDATGSFVTSANTSYGGFSVVNTTQNATGNFGITYGLTDAVSVGVNGAQITNSGNGSSVLYAHTSTVLNSNTGSNPLVFAFGRGGGSYTGATITAAGTGTVVELAGASNSIGVHVGAPYAEAANAPPLFTIPGNGTPGSASFNLTIGYNGNLYIPNFSLSGN